VAKVLMIFLDGVGIGKEDPEINPFFKYEFKLFSHFFGETPSLENQYLEKNGTYLFPVDPVMGVEGLPLSGTGQTSIFCGINAQKKIGQHFGPFPYSTLIPDIKEKNIFKEFLNRNKKVSFANAYPKVFFDYINSGKKRLSVTSLSCLLTGVKLYKAAELHRGKALSAEITNFRWVNKLKYKLPVIRPETAARRLLKMNNENDFTLFEFFFSDHLGHGRLKDEMEYILDSLDRFLLYLLENVDEETTLLVCSDHGNLEDLSVKSHTLNPSMTIAAGKNAKRVSDNIKDLSQIKEVLLEGVN